MKENLCSSSLFLFDWVHFVIKRDGDVCALRNNDMVCALHDNGVDFITLRVLVRGICGGSLSDRYAYATKTNCYYYYYYYFTPSVSVPIPIVMMNLSGAHLYYYYYYYYYYYVTDV